MKVLRHNPPKVDVPKEFPDNAHYFQIQMARLLRDALDQGVVLTVDTMPLQPPVMGNNVLVVHARPLRNHQG